MNKNQGDGMKDNIKITPLEKPAQLYKEPADSKESAPESLLLQNHFTVNDFIKGILFSEILQPPRALRPMVKRVKK